MHYVLEEEEEGLLLAGWLAGRESSPGGGGGGGGGGAAIYGYLANQLGWRSERACCCPIAGKRAPGRC